MNMYPVNSSRISQAGWKDGTLRVEFKNGGTYEYAGVPHAKYVAMIQASSPGKYLGEQIVGQHDHEKLE